MNSAKMTQFWLSNMIQNNIPSTTAVLEDISITFVCQISSLCIDLGFVGSNTVRTFVPNLRWECWQNFADILKKQSNKVHRCKPNKGHA